jgi:RNA polymerase sigma-70 factor (ECF subfamily)
MVRKDNDNTYDILVEHIKDNQKKYYRIAYCYVYQKEAALDIFQNSICKALENYRSIKDEKAIKTWFYRILINESLQYINRAKREIPCEPFDLKDEVYYEEAYEPKLEIFQKVCELPEEMKAIVILHYYEQMTLKEISQTLKVNISTVKSRLYAALRRLRKEMEDNYEQY